MKPLLQHFLRVSPLIELYVLARDISDRWSLTCTQGTFPMLYEHFTLWLINIINNTESVILLSPITL